MSGVGVDGGPVRVVVVDDDALVRAALRMVLGATGDVVVVSEAADGEEAVEQVTALAPDVVLMDVRMPRRDGISATSELVARTNAQVLVLTTFAEDEAVLAALSAGACGFLLKDTPPLRIVEAVRQAAAGEMAVSPSVVRRLVGRVLAADGKVRSGGADGAAASRRARARAALAQLSEREHDVAMAVAEGRTNAEIGQHLHLSAATVKAHLSRVMDKLGLTNRVQVAITVHDADLQ